MGHSSPSQKLGGVGGVKSLFVPLNVPLNVPFVEELKVELVSAIVDGEGVQPVNPTVGGTDAVVGGGGGGGGGVVVVKRRLTGEE